MLHGNVHGSINGASMVHHGASMHTVDADTDDYSGARTKTKSVASVRGLSVHVTKTVFRVLAFTYNSPERRAALLEATRTKRQT